MDNELFNESKVFIGTDTELEFPDFTTIETLPVSQDKPWWEDTVHGAPKDFSFEYTIPCAREAQAALMRLTSPMWNIVRVVRNFQMLYGNRAGHLEMSYGLYRTVQHYCHRDFGCNLKRFLRENGVKVRVRYKTKNDHWVWMK